MDVHTATEAAAAATATAAEEIENRNRKGKRGRRGWVGFWVLGERKSQRKSECMKSV